jgi:hypothetical protein
LIAIRDLITMLEGWRPNSGGRVSRCPAHSDGSPSLSIREAEDGRILLHCFAGCTVDEICNALDLTVADLFPRRVGDNFNRVRVPPGKPYLGWESTAWRLKFHALLLWLRADAVLQAAKGLDTSSWSEAENDVAMRAVHKAARDIARADILEEVACRLRARGLAKEGAWSCQ